jgi:hypothetical protein
VTVWWGNTMQHLWPVDRWEASVPVYSRKKPTGHSTSCPLCCMAKEVKIQSDHPGAS